MTVTDGDVVASAGEVRMPEESPVPVDGEAPVRMRNPRQGIRMTDRTGRPRRRPARRASVDDAPIPPELEDSACGVEEDRGGHRRAVRQRPRAAAGLRGRRARQREESSDHEQAGAHDRPTESAPREVRLR